MTFFSEEKFETDFNFPQLEQTVIDAIQQSLESPAALHLFMQRYIYFNGYASSVIARLASSIAMSRYQFSDPDVSTIDEADRGFEIAAEVMIAAADEVGLAMVFTSMRHFRH